MPISAQYTSTTGPPGSITAETPMTPRIPEGYWYFQFCWSAGSIVIPKITTFLDSA
jgi:hypothetical protein